MHHVFFCLLSLPLFSICFLRHLRSNGVADLFLTELKATSSAWRDVMQISPLDCSYCWHIYFNSCSSSFFLFCFVNLKSWRVSEHIVRFCCLCFSLPADASVLLPIWSVPYLNNSAVQTHCLSSVQCTAESTNPTDCTASRYLRPFSFLHLLTVPFADETHWLCFNCELKNSGESWWLFSLTVCWKLRNSLLGHTKQEKNGYCILHHCCSVCSAMSLVLHMTGAWKEHEQSHCIFKAQFYPSSCKLCKTFVKWHVSAPCQRSVAVQTGLVLCLSWLCSLTFCCAWAWGPVRWSLREQFHRNVQLEGGPLHCKRVSSRSHSEPVSFPAVSCHSWWHQSKRHRQRWVGACWGAQGYACERVLAFQMNKQLFWLRRFLFKSSVVCFFSANLHSHNVSNSNPKEVVLFPGRACNYRCTG